MLDPTLQTLQTNEVEFDEIVIRLKRALFYGKPDFYHADIRKSPTPLGGGSFKINSEATLEKFRARFVNQVAIDLTGLSDELYSLLPLSLREALPLMIQTSLEQGRGIRLIIEARAGEKADRLLRLPWELFLHKRNMLIWLVRDA